MQAEPGSTKEFTKVKLASAYDVPFTADRVIQGVAYDFLAHGEKLQQAAMEYGEGFDDVFPDEIDWNAPHMEEVLKGFGNVLNHDFEISQKGFKTQELHTAMNLPIICAINQHAPTVPSTASVCVIGADKGQNISQCEVSLNSKPIGWDIVAIEPNFSVRKNLTATLDDYPNATLLPYKLQDVMSKRLLEEDGKFKQFDMIIHNLGMHVTCASQTDREMYVKFMRDHLKDDGVAICTSIDMDAVMRADDLGLQSPSRTIQLLHHYPPSPAYVEGMMTVRVDATTFNDPVLSTHAIWSMFDTGEFEVKVVPGRHLFRDPKKTESTYIPLFEPPKHLLNASRRGEIAIVLYIEIRKINPDRIVPIKKEIDDIPSPEWIQCKEWTSNEVAKCRFPLNHGRPLTTPDLVYLQPTDTYVACKRNGVAGCMYIQRGVALLMVDDNRLYKAIKLSPMDNHDMQLQVEVLTKPEGLVVVVLDPYRIGIHTPMMFRDRWNLFKSIYETSNTLKSLCLPQTYKIATKENFEIARKYWKSHPNYVDGLVLQNMWALPGSFRHKLGSARYLKDKYTIDIQLDGRIVEVDFDAFNSATSATKMIDNIVILRERPDKKRSNTLMQYHALQVALRPDDWLDHASLARTSIEVGHVPSLLDVLAGVITVSAMPMDEKLLIYRGRFDDHALLSSILEAFPVHRQSLIYNYYLERKAEILKEVIVANQKEVDRALYAPSAVIQGDQLKYFTVVKSKDADEIMDEI
jgi:hypothetical protein